MDNNIDHVPVDSIKHIRFSFTFFTAEQEPIPLVELGCLDLHLKTCVALRF
jgi:hypothetical protein